MGYFSEVAIVLSESDWESLVAQNKDVEYSVFDRYNEKKQFELKELGEGIAKKMVLVRWYCIKWYAYANESVKSIQKYLDRQDGPYEFLRIGEDEFDIEYLSFHVDNEILGVNAENEIEVYL